MVNEASLKTPAASLAKGLTPSNHLPRASAVAKPYPSNLTRSNYGSNPFDRTEYNTLNLHFSDLVVLGAITLVAVFVRLFRIDQPSSVVFDEMHFGGFVSKYIKGEFFVDVHPPLAKILITLAAWRAGFDGGFDFRYIGKNYGDSGVPYVTMRLIPATCGVLAVLIMFLTLKASGRKTSTAALGAGLVCFENGLVTQSRLILLDSALIAFVATATWSWTIFTRRHGLGPRYAFKPSWWFWLAFTGFSLGAAVSVKWVGVLTAAWVGSLTTTQLWIMWGDNKNVTIRIWLYHLFARVVCLIVIPVAIYILTFAIHLAWLVNPGDGDKFMSPEFQSTLKGRKMADMPVEVAFGSRVSLRHYDTQGGYLHSHAHTYPTGSKQQQITVYPYRDRNNIFIIENQTQPLDLLTDPMNTTSISGPLAWDGMTPEYVVDGSILRLYHTGTDRRVHSHDARPPVTQATWQREVSAYGYKGFEGDGSDLFRLEIVKSMCDSQAAKTRLRAIQTKFKLVHLMTGCVLFSRRVKLPDWGFEQQEVTCAHSSKVPNCVWYVETNAHPRMKDDAEKVNYSKPGFFSKFLELHIVMWTMNSGFVESHPWDSRPSSWPLLRRGIGFWGKDDRQIHFLGNPLIWWSSTAAVAVYALFKGLAVLWSQRSCNDHNTNALFKQFDKEVGTYVLAWAFHYFPFYLMQRQLFLHHYLPALFFAIVTLCQIFEFAINQVSRFGPEKRTTEVSAIGLTLGMAFLLVNIIVFGLYAPLTYGNQWTRAECNRVKLFETWDWNCDIFHDAVWSPNSLMQIGGLTDEKINVS